MPFDSQGWVSSTLFLAYLSVDIRFNLVSSILALFKTGTVTMSNLKEMGGKAAFFFTQNTKEF